MLRVTGIGGIFIKARDAERLREWYRKVMESRGEQAGALGAAPGLRRVMMRGANDAA